MADNTTYIDQVLLRVTHKRNFLAKINYSAEGGCWLWCGVLDEGGYGRYSGLLAHRVSFALFIDEPGRTGLDHICKSRPCVNPYHLRRATEYENSVLYSDAGIAAINAKKTHCVHGHEFTDDNTRHSVGVLGRPRRHCRECVRTEARSSYWKRKKSAVDLQEIGPAERRLRERETEEWKLR